MKSTISKCCAMIFVAGTLILQGCATTSQWNDASYVQLTSGMSQAQVVEIFGQPDSKLRNSEGKTMWIYQRASDDGGFKQKYIAVATMGLAAGKDSVLVDVLTIEFENDIVSSHKYVENMRSSAGFQ